MSDSDVAGIESCHTRPSLSASRIAPYSSRIVTLTFLMRRSPASAPSWTRVNSGTRSATTTCSQPRVTG